ncbi:hypothetical protein LZ626_19385 [Aeromonas allosaccharophila]|uniref:hypothetical protein n=1 Tax=Aeromonas allosaccharophila TaxID=656 RepID=UPI001F390B20|nr:hypothetical protein [Aeromonas allosaccharophila]MCE9850241.1 hypothetical protein [Aeromonas allosaccharophila]
MKNKIANVITAIVIIASAICMGYIDNQQTKRITVLEEIVQAQQEIICLNVNSLPIQFQEHKEACYGVEGGVLLRHQ